MNADQIPGYIGLAGVCIAIIREVLARKKTKAETHSLEGKATLDYTAAYHQLIEDHRTAAEDQARRLETQARKIDALEARVTLAEAHSIRAEAEAQRSLLSEARCLEQLGQLQRRVTELENTTLNPSGPHIVTTVTTVDAPSTGEAKP